MKKRKKNPKRERKQQKRKEKRRASQKARKGGPGIAYKAAMARIRREIEDEPTPIMRWGDMTEALKPGEGIGATRPQLRALLLNFREMSKPIAPVIEEGEVHVEMSDETAANLRAMGEPEPDTYHGIPVVTDENDGNFLSEVADIIKDAWLCPCGYQNNGPICTKCGATHNE